jgi:hypothetical protein
MDQYRQRVVDGFSDIIIRYNKFQLSLHTSKTVDQGNEIIADGILLLNMLKQHTNALETALSDCQDFMEDVSKDLAVEPHKEDFVYSTFKGMLSYKGRDFIPKKKVIKEKQVPPVATPNIERMLIPEIGYYINVQKVDKLTDIPSVFTWYDNPKDTENPPGLYCTIIPNVHVRVPFPAVVDSTKEYGRGRSIRCKYATNILCDDQRSKMAMYHKSQVRTCNFAHTGDDIVKVGYPSRCTKANFGNSDSLTKDIRLVKILDIKNILLYGLNDIMASIIWLDYNQIENTVFNNIEKA